MRPSPGKDFCIILDHAGNCASHGLPDDEREWTLEGNKGNKQDNEATIKIKTCPKCYAVQRPGNPKCSFCGFIYEVQARKVEEVDGDLIEVDANTLRRQRLTEQGGCKSREDLLSLARKRGYKNPYGWVHIIMQARQRKKNANKMPIPI